MHSREHRIAYSHSVNGFPFYCRPTVDAYSRRRFAIMIKYLTDCHVSSHTTETTSSGKTTNVTETRMRNRKRDRQIPGIRSKEHVSNTGLDYSGPFHIIERYYIIELHASTS